MPTQPQDRSSASDDLVLRAVREHGPLSRQDLAVFTGLSAATVNRVTARLTTSRVLVAAGHRASTGGRPSELLRYNGSALNVAGLSVTESGAAGILMTLDGEIIYREAVEFPTHPTAVGPTAEHRLDQTLRLFDSLLDARPEPPLAAGVAVPGVVDERGMITAIHELGWDRLSLRSLLSGRRQLPVILENDANCLAIGEHVHGVGQEVDDLVAIVIRSGLGAGLVLNGRLYRGFHQEAGEIGYLLSGRDSLRRLFPGRGELETLIGTNRINNQAAELSLDLGPGPTTVPHWVVAATQAGGPARAAAEETLDYVALAIASLCVVLDPKLVILGGTNPGEVEAVIPRLDERLHGRILRVPRILPATLGDDAITVGAAQLALAGLNTR